MGDRCEPSTGWMYCTHAEGPLTVCRCSCTCTDQRHCSRLRMNASTFVDWMQTHA